jgi:CheY-like chemotaxis protein
MYNKESRHAVLSVSDTGKHFMKKILVVDDSKEIRQLVKTTLESDFYKVYEASNGLKAVEAARKYTPDLIIMDVVMPGSVDGIEATKQIKINAETKNCQIIILSGSEDFRSEDANNAGACDFFPKPFSPLDLIEKVDLILGAR